MKTWTLLFDVDRCNGCCNCVLATLDEYTGNTHPGYSEEFTAGGRPWLDMEVIERGAEQTVDVAYMPSTCRHCEDAPCIREAPQAVTRRPDGIVRIDPVKAKGAHHLVSACPFGAIHWNEKLQLPQHWNLDAHLLDSGWREPRASQACPTAALRVLKTDDAELKALVSQGYRQTEQDARMRSRLFVRGLSRLQSELIGGSVARLCNGQQEPVVAAKVVLFAEGKPWAKTTTDEMGAFRFDDLAPLPTSIEINVETIESTRTWVLTRDAVDGRFRVGVLQFDATSTHMRKPI